MEHLDIVVAAVLSLFALGGPLYLRMMRPKAYSSVVKFSERVFALGPFEFSVIGAATILWPVAAIALDVRALSRGGSIENAAVVAILVTLLAATAILVSRLAMVLSKVLMVVSIAAALALPALLALLIFANVVYGESVVGLVSSVFEGTLLAILYLIWVAVVRRIWLILSSRVPAGQSRDHSPFR